MRRSSRPAAAVVLLAAALAFLGPAASARQGSGPDLSRAALEAGDLPAGFAETADLFTVQGLIAELLARSSQGGLQSRRVFADGAGREAVDSVVIGPLSPAEQEQFDRWVADPVAAVQDVADSVPPFGASGTWEVLDTAGLGDSSLACRVTAARELERVQAAAATRLEVALARRGAYLLAVADTYQGDGEPLADAVALARRLDERLAAALGISPGGFRPPGVLEPGITTHIPTPADLSTDPAVVGTNLLFAALAMLAFVAASEVLDHTLAEHEAQLQRVLAPARWLGRAQRRLDAALATRLGSGRLLDRARLAGIVALYGVIFSLLEPGWHPFSVTGLWLFLTMATACGLAGLAGDLGKRAAARRRQIPTTLELRPANLLVAAASAGCSRAFSVLPGLMFGRPEALEVDQPSLDSPAGGRVLGAGALALAGVGAGAWLLTIPTSQVLGADPPGWVATAVGGVQAWLLLVFAVATQNLFLEFLTLPGTAGRYLARRHRLGWFLALTATGFLFWHTLLNPRGDLAAALQVNGVRLFLVMVAVFIGGTAAIGLYARRAGAPAAAAPAGPAQGAAAETRAAPPSWYPDPSGRHQYRYWDGSRWTDRVADHGEPGRDPPRP